MTNKADEKKSDDEVPMESGEQEVQAKMDEINAKGYDGTAVDPTPNEAYTVAGVTSGQPTPETDPELRAEARRASGLI